VPVYRHARRWLPNGSQSVPALLAGLTVWRHPLMRLVQARPGTHPSQLARGEPGHNYLVIL